MIAKMVKWFSVFVVLVMLAVAVPQTASAEGSVGGIFPHRTFSVVRSTPGGPTADVLSVDIMPAQTGNWSVTADTIAGSKVIVQVWRNDDGVLTLQSSSRLRAVGEESTRTLLMAGVAYSATFTPFGKAGTSVLHEHFMAPGEIVWIHQFGTSQDEYEGGIAVDDTGIYLAGRTLGTLPGQTSAGSRDAFVRKYDPDGNELWTRQFGTPSEDDAIGVAVDASGIYVVGYTSGALPGQTYEGAWDAFVRKYDSDGNELWTRQFGTPYSDFGHGIAADGSGVYVGGKTNGALPGQTEGGVTDGFVRKYDPDGNELWTRQFGWGAGTPYIAIVSVTGIAVDNTGVYIAGYTEGDESERFVRKYDLNGNGMHQFMTTWLFTEAIAVDASGVYVAGGGGAGVQKCDLDGNEVWRCLFGTPWDDVGGIAVDASGVYVAGYTEGALPGQTSGGGSDAFVRKYDLDGNELWTNQFGSTEEEGAWPIAVGDGGLYVAGEAWSGSIPPYGDSDVFVARLLP